MISTEHSALCSCTKPSSQSKHGHCAEVQRRGMSCAMLLFSLVHRLSCRRVTAVHPVSSSYHPSYLPLSLSRQLSSLYDVRLPISKAKMSQITRLSMSGVKMYKHIVQSVERFIHKVSGLGKWRSSSSCNVVFFCLSVVRSTSSQRCTSSTPLSASRGISTASATSMRLASRATSSRPFRTSS